jgi:hypothetical protein
MRLVPFALILVAGCYQIDGDISGLSTSSGQQSFTGAGAAAGQSVEIDRMLSFDANSSLVSTLRSARIDTVTLSPSSGITSLDFLSSLTLILHSDAGDVPLVDASGQMASPDGAVRLPVNVDVDPALLAAPMHIAASVRFLAPAGDWSMRIYAALTVRGHVDWKP